MPLGFLGVSFCFWIGVVVLCSCRCRTVANFVCFLMAQLARVLMLVYLSLAAPHAFCSSGFIPPSSHSPAVELSSPVSLATSRNSFQYSVIDFLPCFMFLSVILASPLVSMTPNWFRSSWANPTQFSHVDGISSSVYGVIHLPTSSLSRLIAYRIFRRRVLLPTGWP